MPNAHGPARPNLFIIGAPKCGTTSLYEYLKGHPQVYMSPAKEPGYFSLDPFGQHHLRHGVDHDKYMDLFSGARDERCIGEASVGYIYSADAPGLISEFQPAARIIAMLRNPVDMVQSLHAQRLAEGREPKPHFEAAILRKEANYLDRALFARHLQRWFDAFDRERMLVIILEDMERDPAGTFRRTLEFLDIDPDYQPAEFAAHNVRHRPRSQVMRRLLKTKPAQWVAWQALPRLVGDARTRQLVRGFRHSPLNRASAERADMTPETRARLTAFYADDVISLGRLLDRDMTELWFSQKR